MSLPITFPHPPVVEADYKDPGLDDYRNNPLIEALPLINDPADLKGVLTVRPKFMEKERALPAYLRRHCVLRLRSLIVQRAMFIPFEATVSGMIRYGYKSRNPLNPRTLQMLYALGMNDPAALEAVAQQTSDAGACIVSGPSGAGKSVMVECTLALYPQVILHKQYRDHPLIQPQVVYLIFECPRGGSPRALCLEFFRELDKRIGHNYYEQYANSRLDADALLDVIAQLCATYFIGILVIDEIQNLEAAIATLKNKKNGETILGPNAKQLLNFFVKLINRVGVPIIFVGTGDVNPLFKETLRHIRRATADGHFRVGRIRHDSPEWLYMVEQFMPYQWLEHPLPFNHDATLVPGTLESGLLAGLNYLSCGLPDIFAKLFAQSQYLALRSGKETLSTPLIEEAYNVALQPLHYCLDQLRATGPEDELEMRYEAGRPTNDVMESLWQPPNYADASRTAGGEGAASGINAGKEKDPEKADTREAITDLPPQFASSTSDIGANNEKRIDLRTLKGAPNAVSRIREAGMTLNLTDIAK